MAGLVDEGGADLLAEVLGVARHALQVLAEQQDLGLSAPPPARASSTRACSFSWQ
jgi:hypothetical protein